MALISDRNNKFSARLAAAEWEPDASALALDKEQAKSAARLPKAAKGAKLEVQDAKERRGDVWEEGVRELVEVEGILEDAERQRSREGLC